MSLNIIKEKSYKEEKSSSCLCLPNVFTVLDKMSTEINFERSPKIREKRKKVIKYRENCEHINEQ
jgi:hypothetical protein